MPRTAVKPAEARILPGNLRVFVRSVQGIRHSEELLALLAHAKSAQSVEEVALALGIPAKDLADSAETGLRRLARDDHFHKRFHHLRSRLPDLVL